MSSPASDFLLSKELAVVDTWDEWWRVSPQDREKYFFMAGVSDVYILDEYRKAAASICASERTENEARRYLRGKLLAINYQAEEGKDGTLEDLFSRERMSFELGLWRSLAWGWYHWQEGMRKVNLAMSPAYKLKAWQKELSPEWQARWKESAQAVEWQGVVKNENVFVALKTSPIWTCLSILGLPYSPFDADSHSDMMTREVEADECIKLGLITEEEVRAILHSTTNY